MTINCKNNYQVMRNYPKEMKYKRNIKILKKMRKNKVNNLKRINKYFIYLLKSKKPIY